MPFTEIQAKMLILGAALDLSWGLGVGFQTTALLALRTPSLVISWVVGTLAGRGITSTKTPACGTLGRSAGGKGGMGIQCGHGVRTLLQQW